VKIDRDLHLADVYSETADSITIKEHTDDTYEYATPEDAVNIKRAKKRSSISEGEYDVVQQSVIKDGQQKQTECLNTYSHVAISKSKTPEVKDVAIDDNVYDVSSCAQQTSAPLVMTSGGNIYGNYETATGETAQS